MDLASACPLCGRAVGNTGYMVVERAYWYHDCGALGLAPGAPVQAGSHALPAAATAPALPAGGRPTLLDAVFQPRSRLTISPAPDAITIQRFCTALGAHAAVRDVELEQFIGQMAVLLVDATSLSDLITALLNVEQFPVSGLTVTADGQLSARLDEQAIGRLSVPREAVAPQPAPTQQGGPRYSELQERVQRLARDLGALVARAPVAPSPAALPSFAPATPRDEAPELAAVAPQEDASRDDEWDAAPPSAPEPPAAETPALGAHIWQALDRLAALRKDATREAEADLDDQPDEGEREPLALATATLPFPPDISAGSASFLQPAATVGALARDEAEPATVAIASRAVAPPQSIQVVAYPFENFSGVNSFINAVRLLPDVRYVAPRRFRAGTIQLAVDYLGEESLAERLRSLTGFAPRIVSEDDDSVTVAIGGER